MKKDLKKIVLIIGLLVVLPATVFAQGDMFQHSPDTAFVRGAMEFYRKDRGAQLPYTVPINARCGDRIMTLIGDVRTLYYTFDPSRKSLNFDNFLNLVERTILRGDTLALCPDSLVIFSPAIICNRIPLMIVEELDTTVARMAAFGKEAFVEWAFDKEFCYKEDIKLLSSVILVLSKWNIAVTRGCEDTRFYVVKSSFRLEKQH